MILMQAMQNAFCPCRDTGKSERTSLRTRVVGRGTRVGESGTTRDRGESTTHRAGEGATGTIRGPTSPSAAALQISDSHTSLPTVSDSVVVTGIAPLRMSETRPEALAIESIVRCEYRSVVATWA